MLNQALISICLVVSLVSCASTPTAPGTSKSTVAAAGAAPMQPAGCVSADSAARLPAGAINCSGAGSVYTRSDIDRTGQTDVGEALRTLSTTLTVHP